MTRRAWLFDGLLVAGVFVLGQLEAWSDISATAQPGPHWARALLYGLPALALIFRRVRPFGCLIFVVGWLCAGFVIIGAPEGNAVLFLVLIPAYSVARYEANRRLAYIGLAGVVALWATWAATDPQNHSASDALASIVWLAPWVIAWLVGALVRSRQQLAGQQRVEREQRAAQAVAEERNRIARELHDVIGHSVSVMTVQASAVRRRLTPEQERERQALLTVETVGREALIEMRRMVGVLRTDDWAPDRTPAPGLADLDQLVSKFRDSGLAIELRIDGQLRPLPAGLDLTAYRLLQEALTNALKHAGSSATVEVSVTYRPDQLDLAVRNDGAPVDAQATAGHGLLGMRERVGVYGGELVARPRPEGGFELLASLPLEAT